MLAARIGISQGEYERMSPLELHIYAEAFRSRMEDETKAKRAEAYMNASLIRMAVWAKHMKSCEQVFPDDVRKRDMSDEEMYENVRALNRLFGGTEEA